MSFIYLINITNLPSIKFQKIKIQMRNTTTVKITDAWTQHLPNYIVSIASNCLLIWVLMKNKKELLNHVNNLIVVGSMLSLLGTFINLPKIAIT